MMRRALSVVLGAGLATGLMSVGASAYFAEDPAFGIRGGAAAATLQIELGPVEFAIRDRLSLLEAATELGARDIEGVIAFYEARGYQPAWTSQGALTEAAIAVIARLGAAAADGLDPRAYHVPALEAGGTPVATAEAEVMLSIAVAAYAREASSGRIDPRTIPGTIDIAPDYPDPAAALQTVATAADPAAALAGFNPTHPQYLALRDELARLRSAEPVERIIVPDGGLIRLGDVDERVPLLRERLGLAHVEDEELANIYDEGLETAVRDFQQGVGLVSDGVVGPNTLNALNGPNIDPVAEIIANMERWRWLPQDLGDYYVHVNVPEFMVRIMSDGTMFHETRVVVGTVSNRTPIFSDEIEHLIVNPYWNVPASIVAEEMLPILRSDPGYFNRNNFDVFARWNGSVSQVNPVQIDWWQLSASQVSMRQRPGGGNALGQIKFMFPNHHAVYLHDTPSKSLFQRDVRAFSHGCIRVMNPMDFADALLSRNSEWDGAALTALFGDRERQVDLTTHIPVHITYFTAVADADGAIQFKNDIYGYSAIVRDRLGLTEPQVAAN